jgi:hypothetical protein
LGSRWHISRPLPLLWYGTREPFVMMIRRFATIDIAMFVGGKGNLETKHQQ